MTMKYTTTARNVEETWPFTYTYTRPNDTLTLGEESNTETYNAGNNTLSLSGSDGFSSCSHN